MLKVLLGAGPPALDRERGARVADEQLRINVQGVGVRPLFHGRAEKGDRISKRLQRFVGLAEFAVSVTEVMPREGDEEGVERIRLLGGRSGQGREKGHGLLARPLRVVESAL